MNETCISRNNGCALREDGQGTVRAGCSEWNGDGVLDWAVCVGNGQLHQTNLGGVSGALNCMHDQQAVVYPGVGITSPENRSNPQPGDPSCALTNDSRNYLVQEAKPPRKYIVRRLTPTECARLQGFPDEWCEGLGDSDSAIYKAYGNGLALPCAYDVMNRIARFVDREKEGQKIGRQGIADRPGLHMGAPGQV